MKAKFIGKIADHHGRASLYEYLDRNNNIIEVEKDENGIAYDLTTNQGIWSFTEDELQFIDDEGKFNHLIELIKGIPDRTSCVAYVVGYSKYNTNIEKDDLICILEYILNNKSNREV